VFDVPLDVCLARNASRGRVVPETVIVVQHNHLVRAVRTLAAEVDHVITLTP
jgi:predicted kinase